MADVLLKACRRYFPHVCQQSCGNGRTDHSPLTLTVRDKIVDYHVIRRLAEQLFSGLVNGLAMPTLEHLRKLIRCLGPEVDQGRSIRDLVGVQLKHLLGVPYGVLADFLPEFPVGLVRLGDSEVTHRNEPRHPLLDSRPVKAEREAPDLHSVEIGETAEVEG